MVKHHLASFSNAEIPAPEEREMADAWTMLHSSEMTAAELHTSQPWLPSRTWTDLNLFVNRRKNRPGLAQNWRAEVVAQEI